MPFRRIAQAGEFGVQRGDAVAFILPICPRRLS
jgi:hypothetical protein